jgi:hypothetical protein
MANARVELTVSLEDFAASLGLGHGTARNAPVVRTLERLVHFGLARWHDDALEVRLTVSMLSERQLRRLPPVLQAAPPSRRGAQESDIGENFLYLLNGKAPGT